jgi:hypothetical protein
MSALFLRPAESIRDANERSALDARTALCLHIEAQWPGASESERWVVRHA